jgi:type IV secretion system protein VirB11
MSQQSNDFLPSFNRAASVNYLLGFAKEWMEDPTITEVCVNRPGEVFCERQNVWERHEVKELTQDKLLSLATAVAKYSNNDVSENRPILSAIMPGGEPANTEQFRSRSESLRSAYGRWQITKNKASLNISSHSRVT